MVLEVTFVSFWTMLFTVGEEEEEPSPKKFLGGLFNPSSDSTEFGPLWTPAFMAATPVSSAIMTTTPEFLVITSLHPKLQWQAQGIQD